MLEGPLVFVDVDTQCDFLEPTGRLYVPGSIEIRPNLHRLTGFATRRRIPILATACSHTTEDAELARFPAHCMRGTSGQERVHETQCTESVVLTAGARLVGELPLHLTLEKHEIDLFSRDDAEDIIAMYNRSSPTFVVYGVATDYCVKAVVDGLLMRLCRVAIVVDAVRGIDASIEAAILTSFVGQGVLLTMTGVVCDVSRS
jgi:nicotinamidase/pyrazinamidase